MSTKTILVDDLDGTEAFRSIRFSFDGRLFEIDLSREHYDSFKHGLGPWMEAGREITKNAGTGSRGPRGPYRNGKQNQAIRQWGRDHGMTVPDNGPIPKPLLVAYDMAHAQPQDA
jgi:hypothetical protein